MDIPKPRRDVQYIPINYKGKMYITLQDRIGLIKENVLLPPPLYNFLVLMDSSSSIEELQVQLMKQNRGVFISKEEILKVIEELDELYLLESTKFFHKRNQVIEEFSAQSVRPCCFSGKSYPHDRDELIGFLDSILSTYEANREYKEIKGIFAPHIDISIGKMVYAKAYSVLKGKKFSQVVVLGVGHGLADGVFCITDKSFETPLGMVFPHTEAIHRLKKLPSPALSNSDFEHKFEHSIEFQLIFLKHLLGEFRIIPILCGSLLYFLPEYSRKEFLLQAGEFLDTLKDIIEDDAEDTLVVAGVDMCHIGPKFGHEEDVYSLMSSAQNHDVSLLECVVKRDREGFWKESTSIGDRFNVCGFSALATLMEVLDYSGGMVLDYEINIEETTKSGVGFAAGVLY